MAATPLRAASRAALYFDVRLSRIVAVLLILVFGLPSLARAAHSHATPAPNPSGKALVLEPFGTQLGFGPDAGSDVVAALTSAGFSVDVLRDDAVTVPAMQNMSQYSVIYLETHSQTVDNHGFVLTGDQDAADYAPMRRDCAPSNPNFCALMQGFAGHDSTHLYNAITDRFIQDDLTGLFPNSSIIVINGCNLLQAPSFWTALSTKNSGVMVSWDDEVDSAITEPSASLLFKDLAAGMSVKDAIAAVTAAGLGISTFTDPFTNQSYDAHLGFLGDGTDTLARARDGAAPEITPIPSPTAKPTAKPKPTATPKPRGKCKKGYHISHGKCVKTKKKTKHRK
jgi:hypothetical protein